MKKWERWLDVSKPRHCRTCGRRLRLIAEDNGYDDSGGRRVDYWLECPRFARSWRNLWFGGIGHKSLSVNHWAIERRYM